MWTKEYPVSNKFTFAACCITNRLKENKNTQVSPSDCHTRKGKKILQWIWEQHQYSCSMYNLVAISKVLGKKFINQFKNLALGKFAELLKGSLAIKTDTIMIYQTFCLKPLLNTEYYWVFLQYLSSPFFRLNIFISFFLLSFTKTLSLSDSHFLLYFPLHLSLD